MSLERWLAAFLLTQLVEVPIYGYALRGRLLLAFAASAITHPIVWFVIQPLWPGRYYQGVLLAETFAVAVEALYLRRAAELPRAWAWSIGANAASVMASVITRAFFRWVRAAGQDPAHLVAEAEAKRTRRLVMIELHVLALVPLFAALMARGIGS